MLAAGIAVGVLTVPIIASVAEDALRAVPPAALVAPKRWALGSHL